MIKPNWTSFILLLAVIVLLFLLLSKSCEEPVKKDYSKEYQQLIADTTVSGQIRDSLKTVIDSLEQIPKEITKVVYKKIKDSDELVAKDSSNAIAYFREGLQLWGWLLDKSDYPTYRELKLSGDIAQEGYGFKLKTKLYEEETIPAFKADIKNWSFLYRGSQDLNKIKDEEIVDLNLQLKDEKSFWKSQELWFGLGATATLIAVFVAGTIK